MAQELMQARSSTDARFTALRAAFRCAIDSAFTATTPEEFALYFPMIDAQQRAAVYDAYKQVLQLTSAMCEAEYEDIVEECQLWTKLTALEQACAEQGLDAYGGIVSSSGAAVAEAPEAVAVRSRVEAMTAERQYLAAELAKLEQQRAQVAQQIEVKKQQAADHVGQFKAIPKMLGGIESASQSWNLQPIQPAPSKQCC